MAGVTAAHPGRLGSARSRRTLATATAVVVALVVSACGASSEPSENTRTAPAAAPTTRASSSPSAPAPRAADVVTGLDSPWGLVALKDSSTLVSERDAGKILRVQGDRVTELTRLADVRPGGEGGLLGLVATPDEKTVFAYFTAADDNRIVSMSWDGDRLGEPTPILTGIPKGGRHDGGRLVIGPDGYLYVGTGETGQEQLAQDKSSLGGKILRITLAGQPAPGNPFGTAVYSYGHRNVQGLAFDDQGRLWASEFGDQTWDELNLIVKGGNYGWPKAEGSAKIEGLINPKLVWPTADASPSGLAYWRGELWMAALQGQRLWEIPLDGTTPGEPKARFAGAYGRLRSVTVTRDGRSLLLTGSNTDGRGQPGAGDDRLVRVTQ